jgi:hypothetical protein
MNKTIAFEFDGETKYLVLPSGNYSDEILTNLAEKAIFNQVFIKHQKAGASVNIESCIAESLLIPYEIVDGDTLPKNRYFRAALKANKGKFEIDMDKAAAIHLERIREARDAALVALDTQTIMAVGKGDTEALQAVEAQKQVLRDIPQTIDLSKAQLPEELAAIWPEELK